MSNSSICNIDKTLSGATTPSYCWSESESDEGALSISPKLQYYYSLTVRLFNVISGHSLGESYPFAAVESVYSTAQASRL